MPSMAPEYGVLRAYLDWLTALPWSQRTQDHLDLAASPTLLDERPLRPARRSRSASSSTWPCASWPAEGRTPILCFVGPPGVGKTSLGRSIAEALGRKFVRV